MKFWMWGVTPREIGGLMSGSTNECSLSSSCSLTCQWRTSITDRCSCPASRDLNTQSSTLFCLTIMLSCVWLPFLFGLLQWSRRLLHSGEMICHISWIQLAMQLAGPSALLLSGPVLSSLHTRDVSGISFLSFALHGTMHSPMPSVNHLAKENWSEWARAKLLKASWEHSSACHFKPGISHLCSWRVNSETFGFVIPTCLLWHSFLITSVSRFTTYFSTKTLRYHSASPLTLSQPNSMLPYLVSSLQCWVHSQDSWQVDSNERTGSRTLRRRCLGTAGSSIA